MKNSYLFILKSYLIGLFISFLGTSCKDTLIQQALPTTTFSGLESTHQEQEITVEQNVTQTKEEAKVDYDTIKQDYIKRYGEPMVAFQKTNEGLAVKITTQRLVISSATIEDLPEYVNYLYGSPKVMEKFATGVTQDEAYAKGRFDAWIKRWEGSIPFSGLTIRTKEGEFIGHVVLGGGDESNSSEIAYMIKEDKWRQGYGYEAIGASVLFYGTKLKEQGYVLPNQEIFTRVIATTRKDNIGSERIQKKIGMTYYKSSSKFGHDRDHYELFIDDLLLLKDSNL